MHVTEEWHKKGNTAYMWDHVLQIILLMPNSYIWLASTIVITRKGICTSKVSFHYAILGTMLEKIHWGFNSYIWCDIHLTCMDNLYKEVCTYFKNILLYEIQGMVLEKIKLCLNSCIWHATERIFLHKGLTETALATPWIVLTEYYLQWGSCQDK